jgi:hypothetical protein
MSVFLGSLPRRLRHHCAWCIIGIERVRRSYQSTIEPFRPWRERQIFGPRRAAFSSAVQNGLVPLGFAYESQKGRQIKERRAIPRLKSLVDLWPPQAFIQIPCYYKAR